MGCFEDGLKNISEPYGGNMPLFHSSDTTDATVTIVSESYDDGMRVTKIQTPPRTETKDLISMIDEVLGFVHNIDIDSMVNDGQKSGKKSDKKDSDDNDGLQSSKQQEDKQDSDNSDNGLQKSRGFGSALSQTRVSDEDKFSD